MWDQNGLRSHWLSRVPKTNPEYNPIDAAVSSLGIKEGKESESEVVVMDMLRKRICEQMVEMEYNESRARALLHARGNEDK